MTAKTKFPYAPSKNTVLAMRAACKAIPIPATQLAPLLNDYSDRTSEDYDRRRFTISHDSLSRFIKEPNPKYTTRNEHLLETLWDFLHENFSSYIEEELRNDHVFEDGIDNGFIFHLNDFMRSRRKIDIAMLRSLAGTYQLYRPCFMKPESNIMICHLQCGIGSDLSRWKLAMKHQTRRGQWEEEAASGYVLPYESSALFLGRLDKKVAPFIFIISDIGTNGELDGDEAVETVDVAHGTLLAGAKGSKPSAYPLVLERKNKEEDKYLDNIDKNQFSGSEHGKQIINELNRGIIHWR